MEAIICLMSKSKKVKVEQSLLVVTIRKIVVNHKQPVVTKNKLNNKIFLGIKYYTIGQCNIRLPLTYPKVYFINIPYVYFVYHP